MPSHLTNLAFPIRATDDEVARMVDDPVESLTTEVFGLFDAGTSTARLCQAVLRHAEARMVLLMERDAAGRPCLIGTAATDTAAACPLPPGWNEEVRIETSADWGTLELPSMSSVASPREVVCLPLGATGPHAIPLGCLYLVFGDELPLGRMRQGRRRLLQNLTLPLAAALAWRRLPELGAEPPTVTATADAATDPAPDLAARIQASNRVLDRRMEPRTEELTRSHAELEASLRCLGGTKDQLIHAGKMAAVGALVAGLTHELNNPLGVIIGYTQGILRRTPETATERPSLIAIERHALRCARLVRSLLDFSRSRSSAREETAMAPLVERVLELVGGHARGRQVELRCLPVPALPSLWAAPPEIESALLNVVSNAVDATAAGGSVTIELTPRRVDDQAGIDIRVSDTGSGIPHAILPRIFEPFFTTKAMGQGTGIGLAITRQAVEGHGGQIHVHTEERAGTTMWIWLPASGEPAPASDVARGSDEDGAARRVHALRRQAVR